MALGRWQATIVDRQGNISPGASVEVRSETPGAPLAVLYSDREGANGIGNPFFADVEGFAAFHTTGGAYRIDVIGPGFTRTWRFVPIGTSGETDSNALVHPKGAWSALATYDLADMVSHRDGGGDPYAFASNDGGNINHEPQFDVGGVGESDAFWTVLGLIESPGAPGSSDVVGTSATDLAIAVGTKTFTIAESDRGWGFGARLRASSDANPTSHWMEGIVTAYAVNTLEIEVDLVSGAGNRDDWTINLAGARGAPGTDVTIYDVPTGTPNAILADPVVGKTLHLVQLTDANTAAATFNGLPLLDKDGNALVDGSVQPDIWYWLLHDGVDYRVIMAGSVF